MAWKGEERRDGLDGVVLLAGALPPLWLAVAIWAGCGGVADRVLRGAMLARAAVNLWLGGTLARAGAVAAVFDPAAYWDAARSIFGPALGTHTWSYPPPMLLLAVPVSVVPLPCTILAWNALGAAALWLGARGAGFGVVTSLLAVVSPAALECMLAGQNGLICAALALPGYALLAQRPLLAGALLGALIIKPQSAILVPVCLLALWNWRAMVAAAASAASLAAASAIAFGWESWAGFIGQVLPFMRHAVLEAPWLSATYQPMMATPFMAARWGGASLLLAYLVQALAAAIAVVLCWRAWRTPGADPLSRTALTLALSFVVTPYGYCYDMPALAAALGALAARQGFREGWPRLLFAIAWIMPGLGTLLGIKHMPPLGLLAPACAAILAYCGRGRPMLGLEQIPFASAESAMEHVVRPRVVGLCKERRSTQAASRDGQRRRRR